VPDVLGRTCGGSASNVAAGASLSTAIAVGSYGYIPHLEKPATACWGLHFSIQLLQQLAELSFVNTFHARLLVPLFQYFPPFLFSWFEYTNV